jgi:hypothetical protein
MDVLAFIGDVRTLKVKDISIRRGNHALTPEELFSHEDGDKYFKWSPDSKWLLVDWDYRCNSDVLLMAADGSKRINQ